MNPVMLDVSPMARYEDDLVEVAHVKPAERVVPDGALYLVGELGELAPHGPCPGKRVEHRIQKLDVLGPGDAELVETRGKVVVDDELVPVVEQARDGGVELVDAVDPRELDRVVGDRMGMRQAPARQARVDRVAHAPIELSIFLQTNFLDSRGPYRRGRPHGAVSAVSPGTDQFHQYMRLRGRG